MGHYFLDIQYSMSRSFCGGQIHRKLILNRNVLYIPLPFCESLEPLFDYDFADGVNTNKILNNNKKTLERIFAFLPP